MGPRVDHVTHLEKREFFELVFGVVGNLPLARDDRCVGSGLLKGDSLAKFVFSGGQGDEGELEGVVVGVTLDHVVLFGGDGKACLHAVFTHGELFGVACLH